MKRIAKPVSLIIADDDPEDCILAKDALQEARLVNNLSIVNDGEELIDYLCHTGKYIDQRNSPRPSLIMLDLNMPKKDGREAIKEIKSNPKLRQIPIVVLTTSKAEEDIYRSYELGVNSYITKPVTFEALVDVLKTIGKYWFEIVELPSEKHGG